MGRIRTIKPEYYRHEVLQDMERAHPGCYPMLVFSGLWTVADRAGRFQWRPRTLKLDILPFLDFDMSQTLNLLSDANLIIQYEVGGNLYGVIPTFTTHQRITGKEASAPPRYPDPPRGSTGETPVKHLVAQEKEKEGEKEKERRGASAPDLFAVFWAEYPRHESPRKAREAFVKAGITPELLESIIAWLAEARKSEQWQNKSLIPYATTWLNQRRWEGDPPPPPAVKATPSRDTVGLAETYRPPAHDACPNCDGSGRVLIVTDSTGIVARAPWSETRQARLAGPGEQLHQYRCSCGAGRQHMHLDPEPVHDIEAIA